MTAAELAASLLQRGFQNRIIQAAVAAWQQIATIGDHSDVGHGIVPRENRFNAAPVDKPVGGVGIGRMTFVTLRGRNRIGIDPVITPIEIKRGVVAGKTIGSVWLRFHGAITVSVVQRISPIADVSQLPIVAIATGDRTEIAFVIFPVAEHAIGVVLNGQLGRKFFRMLIDIFPVGRMDVTTVAGLSRTPLKIRSVALTANFLSGQSYIGSMHGRVLPSGEMGKDRLVKRGWQFRVGTFSRQWRIHWIVRSKFSVPCWNSATAQSKQQNENSQR